MLQLCCSLFCGVCCSLCRICDCFARKNAISNRTPRTRFNLRVERGMSRTCFSANKSPRTRVPGRSAHPWTHTNSPAYRLCANRCRIKYVTNSCSRANCFSRTCVPCANSSPTNCIGHVCICESCGMKYVAHLRSRANFLPRTCVRVRSARPRTALVTFLCANSVEWNLSRTRVLEQLSPTNLCFEFAHPRTYYAPRMRHVRTRKNCVPTNSPYFMFVLYVHIYIYMYTFVCKHMYI